MNAIVIHTFPDAAVQDVMVPVAQRLVAGCAYRLGNTPHLNMHDLEVRVDCIEKVGIQLSLAKNRLNFKCSHMFFVVIQEPKIAQVENCIKNK